MTRDEFYKNKYGVKEMYDNIKPNAYIINEIRGSGMAAEAPAVRQSQIEMEYMELQAALDMLLEKMAILVSRLNPVLSNDESDKMHDGTEKSNTLAPLAENIRRLRDKVNQGHGIIDDLMERLEI